MAEDDTDDEIDPTVAEVPAFELITLSALGVALYGDRWLSPMAASMGLSKGHLHSVTRGGTLTPALRKKIRAWIGEQARLDIERALTRVRLFRSAEAAWD